MALLSKGKYLRDILLILAFILYLIAFFLVSHIRSLSELEGLRVGTDMGEKIRQVTERATLFRITSNAMINVRFSQLRVT